MNCELCGLSNEDDARFCSDCGTELPQPSYREAGAASRVSSVDLRQAYPAVAASDREPHAVKGRLAPPPDGSDDPTTELDANADDTTYTTNVIVPVTPGAGDAEIPTSSVGELLMRARNIYLRRFWLFFPLGALPQLPLIISPLDLEAPSPAGVFSLFFGLLLLVVTTAATILAVAQLHVYGRVHVSRCLASAAQVALPMLLVQLVIGFSLVASAILIAVLIGIPLFIYFLLTLYFAPHAVAIERLNPLFALGRSRQLVRGHIVRVFVIGALFVTVAVFVLAAFFVPAVMIAPEDATTLNLVLAFAASLATPLVNIGGTLTYFDLRVRSEGYDLNQLKSEIERD